MSEKKNEVLTEGTNEKLGAILGELQTIRESLTQTQKVVNNSVERIETLESGKPTQTNEPAVNHTKVDDQTRKDNWQSQCEKSGYTLNSDGTLSYKGAGQTTPPKTNEPTTGETSVVKEAVKSAMGVPENLTKSGLLNTRAIDALMGKFGGSRSRYWSISKNLASGGS